MKNTPKSLRKQNKKGRTARGTAPGIPRRTIGVDHPGGGEVFHTFIPYCMPVYPGARMPVDGPELPRSAEGP